jgi:hypothetical protein
MAEVARVPQVPTAAGAAPTVISGMNSADTQVIPNKNSDVILRVINGAAEATKVTIVTPGEVGGNPISDREVEVGATSTKIIGPFDKSTYNDIHGNLNVKLSKVTTVTMEITQVVS